MSSLASIFFSDEEDLNLDFMKSARGWNNTELRFPRANFEQGILHLQSKKIWKINFSK